MQEQHTQILVEINTFDLKKEYEDIEADERTVKVFSTKLDQAAVDNNSFLSQICNEIATTSPNGIKFGQMKNDKFKTRKQQCKIELAVDLADESWPLY